MISWIITDISHLQSFHHVSGTVSFPLHFSSPPLSSLSTVDGKTYYASLPFSPLTRLNGRTIQSCKTQSIWTPLLEVESRKRTKKTDPLCHRLLAGLVVTFPCKLTFSVRHKEGPQNTCGDVLEGVDRSQNSKLHFCHGLKNKTSERLQVKDTI